MPPKSIKFMRAVQLLKAEYPHVAPYAKTAKAAFSFMEQYGFEWSDKRECWLKREGFVSADGTQGGVKLVEPEGYMRPCERCNGEGAVKDGVYMVSCPACDGTGIHTPEDSADTPTSTPDADDSEQEVRNLLKNMSYNELYKTSDDVWQIEAHGFSKTVAEALTKRGLNVLGHEQDYLDDAPITYVRFTVPHFTVDTPDAAVKHPYAEPAAEVAISIKTAVAAWRKHNEPQVSDNTAALEARIRQLEAENSLLAAAERQLTRERDDLRQQLVAARNASADAHAAAEYQHRFTRQHAEIEAMRDLLKRAYAVIADAEYSEDGTAVCAEIEQLLPEVVQP